MKDFFNDYGVGVLVIAGFALLFSFIGVMTKISNKQDIEMAKIGMCFTRAVGTERGDWKPCQKN